MNKTSDVAFEVAFPGNPNVLCGKRTGSDRIGSARAITIIANDTDYQYYILYPPRQPRTDYAT